MASLNNFYAMLPSRYQAEEVKYDSFPTVQIKLPCNMVVVGGTGSGKTNFVMNFIAETNAFTRYYLFAKNLEEPFYKYLIDHFRQMETKTKTKLLVVSNSLDDLPAVDTLDPKEVNLFICDDMVSEKSRDLAKVACYWTRGRKQTCTSLFLTQEYYKTPTIIRNNSRIVVVTKIERKRNLEFILKEFSLGVDDKQIMQLYNQATAGGFPNVFLLDPDNLNPNLKFRRNFVGIPVKSEVANGQSTVAEVAGQPQRKRKLPQRTRYTSDDE